MWAGILIVLGAGINLGTAMIAAWNGPVEMNVDNYAVSMTGEEAAWLREYGLSENEIGLTDGFTQSAFGYTRTDYLFVEDEDIIAPGEGSLGGGSWWSGLIVVRAGWPMRSFKAVATLNERAYDRYLSAEEVALTDLFTSNDGLMVEVERERGWKDVQLIPLRPTWPGFIVNTALIAILIGSLILVPGAIRRDMRRRRGLCPMCAYNLSMTREARCPECGDSTNRPTRKAHLH